MHRFFVPPQNIQGDMVTLPSDIAHQLQKVLRMSAGDEIIVLDNTGMEYHTQLTAVDKKEAHGKILSKAVTRGEPVWHITLCQAMLKRDNFEWVLQKATELGVSNFVPMLTTRTVVDKVSKNKHERWERIVREAAEQCRRGRIPTIDAPQPLKQIVASGFDHVIIPWEDEQTQTLHDMIPTLGGNIAILIGPEGGFTADEVALAQENGAIAVSLGHQILRAETAAIYVSSILKFYQNPS